MHTNYSYYDLVSLLPDLLTSHSTGCIASPARGKGRSGATRYIRISWRTCVWSPQLQGVNYFSSSCRTTLSIMAAVTNLPHFTLEAQRSSIYSEARWRVDQLCFVSSVARTSTILDIDGISLLRSWPRRP